jgi:hypothetical protein
MRPLGIIKPLKTPPSSKGTAAKRRRSRSDNQHVRRFQPRRKRAERALEFPMKGSTGT